eukprot:7381306-Prymnesium_polylepis.1
MRQAAGMSGRMSRMRRSSRSSGDRASSSSLRPPIDDGICRARCGWLRSLGCRCACRAVAEAAGPCLVPKRKRSSGESEVARGLRRRDAPSEGRQHARCPSSPIVIFCAATRLEHPAEMALNA